MKQKKSEMFLYSTVGVVAMFLIVVVVNVLAGTLKFRADMTEHDLFTLSDGTRQILEELESPVEVRFYRSEGVNMPSVMRTFANTVEDMLDELKLVAGSNMEIKKFNPEPDTDEEDLANLDGIQPQVNPNTGESFYLGVAISQDPVKVSLPALRPNRQELMEYDLARAISQVTETNQPVVGVMTPLPMFGQQMNPMMARMGQQPQRPWVVITELQRDFDVREIPMDSASIDEDVQLLMVVHPKEITDQAQYAIDQFVLRGGKLVALLDAKSYVDKPQDGNPMSAMMGGGASNLEKLLTAWGLKFETTQVLADLQFTREVPMQQGGAPQPAPTLLFVDGQGVDQDDVATSQLDNLLFPFAGTFSGTPAEGLEQTVLIHSTTNSQLVDPMTAMFNGRKILDDFDASGKEFPLAVRLRGKFKTAYPDGKPGATNEVADAESDAGDSLKESSKESVVLLVGDSDFIYDDFCVRVIPLFNIAQPINGNLTLVQNVMEQMGGDIRLIGARSRAGLSRPFTVVREMEAQANQRFQDEIKRLEEEKAEAERRLSELQSQKAPGEQGQQFILSQEQQEEIERFRQKQAQANRRLREVRKDLNKDKVSLQNQLKWLNIAGMPVVVTVVGLALAVVRKQRTRAK